MEQYLSVSSFQSGTSFWIFGPFQTPRCLTYAIMAFFGNPEKRTQKSFFALPLVPSAGNTPAALPAGRSSTLITLTVLPQNLL